MKGSFSSIGLRVVRGPVRAAARHADEVEVVAVRLHDRPEDAVVAARLLQHDRAGAVAEQHARVAVRPVDDAGEDLAADDEHVVGLGGLDEAVCQVERVEEADAGGADVGRGRPGRPDVALDQARGRRERHVARDRADEDHVQVLGLHVRSLQRPLGGARAEVREVLALGGDVPLLDPGPRGDPLVRRLDEPLEVGVGEQLLGNVRAGSHHASANQANSPFTSVGREFEVVSCGFVRGALTTHSSRLAISHAFTNFCSLRCSSAICAWIFSARFCLANSAAKRIAFLTAFAEERP
jgi:hypothetical protein